MTKGVKDFGEEWIQKLIINSGETFTVGLYADDDGPDAANISTTDTIDDSSDVSDINAVPAGSAYNPQTDDAANFAASLDSNDNVKITGSTLTYDVSDSSKQVNAFYVSVPYPSDVVGSDGGTETEHIVATGYLGQRYDLGQFDATVDFDPVELTLD